jgi:hypothetical protein
MSPRTPHRAPALPLTVLLCFLAVWAPAAKVELQCATVSARRALAHELDQTESVASARAIMFKPVTREDQVVLSSSRATAAQQGVPLRDLDAEALDSLFQLSCGDGPIPLASHFAVKSRHRHQHSWGAVLSTPDARQPDLLEWVRVMLHTDDHMTARSRANRGTAHRGVVFVVGSSSGCRLEQVRPGLHVGSGSEDLLGSEGVSIDDACAGKWSHEEAWLIQEQSEETGASLLQEQSGDSWKEMSLMELQANSKAKAIPLLKEILTPVVNEGVNQFGNPIFNEVMPDAGGEAGPETSQSEMSEQTPGDLSEMLGVAMGAEVSNAVADAVSHRIANTLSASLTRTVGSFLLRELSISENGNGPESIIEEAASLVERATPVAVSAEVTPRLYNALLPMLLKSIALTTAHSVAPALAAGLQPLRGAALTTGPNSTPERQEHCRQCLTAFLDAQNEYVKGTKKEQQALTPEVLRHCRLCFRPLGPESDYFAYHGLLLTHWYGEYYTEYWRQAAEKYLDKRRPFTEGPLTETRQAAFFDSLRGAPLS